MTGPAVHPLPAPTMEAAVAVARVRMRDVQGMAGTVGALVLRFFQFTFAAASLYVMATTANFPSATAFRLLVAAVCLQCAWSLPLALIDVYALLVKRRFRNIVAVALFATGDGVTSTLTFAAACASAGVTVLIGNDLEECYLNHCKRFMSATAMAFLCWLLVSASFLLNFWSVASRW